MRKQTPELEWHIAESDTEWERQQTLLPPASTPASRRRLQMKRYFGSVTTILLLLTGTGGWWHYTTQAQLQADEAELRTAVQQKPLTAATPDSAALAATIMGEWPNADWRPAYGWADNLRQNSGSPTPVQLGDPGWKDYIREYSGLPVPVLYMAQPIVPLDVVVQSMELLGDQAIANVILNEQDGKPAYRQTRFYRRISNGGWLPVPPDAALWGAGRSLQTPYFVYHFRQRDAAVVGAVAPEIDAFYATLGRNFGLTLSPTAEQLIIQVSVTQPPGGAVGWVKRDTPFRVSSPALYLAPVDLTDADLLAQSLAFPLLDHVVAQARSQHEIGERWHPLLDGLYLWQLWDASLPVANWHDEVVRWLYNDLPAGRSRQPIVVPQHYGQLCATHKLWMQTPVDVHIPLVCAGQEREERFWQRHRPLAPLTYLEQLAVSVSMTGSSSQFLDNHPGQRVALATLVDYAVAAYGQERLPVLLAALGDYDSWQTLIPAVYGVSAAEFEAGWQAYLTAHYEIAQRSQYKFYSIHISIMRYVRKLAISDQSPKAGTPA